MRVCRNLTRFPVFASNYAESVVSEVNPCPLWSRPDNNNRPATSRNKGSCGKQRTVSYLISALLLSLLSAVRPAIRLRQRQQF
jgi:hypothetical protein